MCKYTNKLAEVFKKSDLEILIATMNRNNLDFLIPMFPFAHFSEFSILIINQTNEENLLFSEFENIRVINSYEKGLSKSRNLALENASKKILLIADDDVEFIPDFDQKIAIAYNENHEASIICLQAKTKEGKTYSNYKKDSFWMRFKDLVWVLSIEITFKREAIDSKNIRFNEHFGLGAQFQDAESLYFLRRAKYQNLKILFQPQNIVVHEAYSSSDEVVSDRWLFAKAAGFYKRFSVLGYLYILKVVFFLLRKKMIPFSQIRDKINIGFQGISAYKVLLKKGLEKIWD